LSEIYVRTALRLGWLLEAAEAALIRSDDGAKVDITFFQRLEIGRLPTDDEALAAAEALVSLNVLRRNKSKFTLDRKILLKKADYCQGVRETLRVVEPLAPDPVRLCAAIPVGLDELVDKALRRNTVDMRANLLDIIAGTERWVALASPFWDVETVNEFSEVLIRRLEAGVYVHILSRFKRDRTNKGDPQLIAKLGRYERCKLYAWYQPSRVDRLKEQSFHFKAVVSDDNRAYLGTANMTIGGLRSRMELGVLLEGHLAWKLAQIVKVTLNIARPVAIPPHPTGR
jgi:hypothetical protein